MHFAEGPDDLVTPDELAAMSGLDFMTGILEGRLPAPPIAQPMAMTLVEVDDGRVVFEGRPGFRHYNPMGAVHGGWFGTLLDSCMACAVMTCLPKGQGYTTLEYRVNIVRALTEASGPVRAIGRIRHAGRRTAVAEGEIVRLSDGKLCATGSTTCLVFAF